MKYSLFKKQAIVCYKSIFCLTKAKQSKTNTFIIKSMNELDIGTMEVYKNKNLTLIL